MNDTHPEIEIMLREKYMQMTGAERVLIGARMYDTARAIVLSSLPKNISELERRRLLYERFYGPAPRGLFSESGRD